MLEKMRLLYFINSITNSGGMERIVIDKINYLAGLDGYKVALSYFGSENDTSFFQIDKRVKLKPIGKQKMGSSLMLKLWSFLHLPMKVERIIDDVTPDVIVNANTILISWLLPLIRRNIPKVVELHFSYTGMKIISEEQFGHNWLKRKFNYYLRKWGYPLYDKTVLLTEDDLRDWGFKNAVVIPNFTNLQFEGTLNTERVRTAVNVGRLSPPKNQKLLVEAWSLVHKQEPDWKLEIWGNGEFYDDLTRQIHSLGIDDVVMLKGTSHHIENVYCYASFFVLSSSYEGLPLVMIEALMAGLPCVCTSVNGVRNTIKNEYNGYVIDEHTPQALADGIIKMIRSDNREKMSYNARESARSFEKDFVMKLWTNLFNELTTKDSIEVIK